MRSIRSLWQFLFALFGSIGANTLGERKRGARLQLCTLRIEAGFAITSASSIACRLLVGFEKHSQQISPFFPITRSAPANNSL